MKKEVIIILDNYDYKDKECTLIKEIQDLCIPTFFYTKYENRIIQKFFRIKKIGTILWHISYWTLSFFYALKIFFNHDLKKNKNKIFINPIVGIFYAFISLCWFSNEHLVIAGFLFSQKKNKFYFFIRKQFVNFAYKKVDTIIVYSSNERDVYRSIFPKLKDKFIFVLYGKDFNNNTSFLNKITINERDYIFAGGGSHRDYDTLCKAMNAIDTHCIIATRPAYAPHKIDSPNVEFNYNITIENFGQWIYNSQFFILPLQNTPLSAGHMAMLETMSLGKIILVADIPAIRDYVNEQSVIFYVPGSPTDLRDKINFIIENIDSPILNQLRMHAQQQYYQKYTFPALLRRIITI